MTETSTIEVKLDTKKRLADLKLCVEESYDSVLKRVLPKTEV